MTKGKHGGMILVGADTGGTFTDLIAMVVPASPREAPRTYAHKVLSTPDDPGRAVLQGLQELLQGALAEWAGRMPLLVVHGSTVATNALLERRGVPTAFVTTAGFEDLLLIGRQHRRSLYDLTPDPVAPLIPPERCFGVEERLDASGHPIVPLTEEEAERVAGAVAASGVESVAICLLFSFRNGAHEALLAEALRRRGLHVSASHRVLPEYREFERASTTAINAYVSPLMQRYLDRLADQLGRFGVNRLRVMQSNGGSISAAQAGSDAVHTVLSGPAGGVVGAQFAALRSGFSQVITFDMGGTSTDVSLLPGRVQVTTEGSIDHLPVRVPILDIHTVGAGGGSIAYLDAGGALRVGPRSAGADPGPACYGKGGTEPTVTDAHVVLGRLPVDQFLGGRMQLDAEAARAAVGRLAAALHASVEETAWGILQVANSQMERALRVISVERGFDPAEFSLVSFGGAGGLHAADLARGLGIPRVIVPPHPGVLSAWGMAVADVVKTYSQGVPGLLDRETLRVATGVFARLIRQAINDLSAETPGVAEIHLEPSLDVRYSGQSFELSLPLPVIITPSTRVPDPPLLHAESLREAFHVAHTERYGHRFADPVELVTVRLRAWIPGTGRLLPQTAKRAGRAAGTTARRAVTSAPPKPLRTVTAFIGGAPRETAVYRRTDLSPATRIDGPAIILEPHATTIVGERDRLVVDGHGTLVLEVG